MPESPGLSVKAMDMTSQDILKKVVHDCIITHDLQAKKLLFLLSEGDRYAEAVVDGFNGEYGLINDRLQPETAEESLLCDLELVADDDPGQIKDFGAFDALFVLNLGRPLNEDEILKAILLLSKDGVLFHIDRENVPWQAYDPYLFTIQDNIESSRGIEFSLISSYKNYSLAEKSEEFFENPDWKEKVHLSALWRYK